MAKPKLHIPIFEGVLPIDKARIPAEALAGLTLAALAIPEVMGYSNIAGMPVITGLYTLVLPMMVFAIMGSSRHLVVGADSATAAVMFAGLAPLATAGSPQYVALAGLLALLAGGLMILARLVHLGFIADFLSRTVLIGFLTGVGIQVAMGQLAGMLGVPDPGGKTLSKFWNTLKEIPDTSMTTLAVSAGVIITILGLKLVNKKIPGALFAVVGAIFISYQWDLVSHGVSTLGKVPGGLPSLGFPSGLSWSDVGAVFPTAISIFVLILAQSAATSRAYAAKYNEDFSENTDLVGLGLAEVAACFSGTYVANGSPTKTQMVDGAGGKSQLAQLVTGAMVIIVLLFLTVPLQYMPNAVLASVVFLIGVELVDWKGMIKVFQRRPDEFVVAMLTAATVVVVGVEQGIVLAIVLSIIDHLRKSYRPNNAVIVPDAESRQWRADAATPSSRTMPGLVVYRFNASLYYANANKLFEDSNAFLKSSETSPIRWFCLDLGMMTDVDYTGAEVMRQIYQECTEHSVRLVITEVEPEVLEQLDRSGIVELIGSDAVYPRIRDVIATFESTQPA